MDWLPAQTDDGGPLAGIRVLDFSELLPGPFLTQNLAELGADVIKSERPQGDPTRRSAPQLFEVVNRGKRSVVLDLKSSAGRDDVARLLAKADVLVETFRPGVMARLGLGDAQLRARHPRLVYVSMTGYGHSGPHAGWPSHDINFLAASGIAELSTDAAGQLPKAPVPLGDLVGSVYALACVNAALLQRERNGLGQHLDVALADCVMPWSSIRVASLRAHGGTARPLPAYGVFACADGKRLSIAALEDHFWAALVRSLDLAPFAGDAWQQRPAREAAYREINAAIAERLSTMAAHDALQRLVAADVPVFPVVPAAELPTSRQAIARKLYVDAPSGPTCRFPVRMAGMPASAESPAP